MPTAAPFKPTRADLEAARSRTVPDIIAPELDVLFSGINPGLYTTAIGHHFGRPGNRFWPALHAGGFTPRLLAPHEERELLRHRLGITNVVARTTATAAEVSDDEIRSGGQALTRKVRRFRPRFLAVLGIGAFRLAFDRPRAELGRQPEKIGDTVLWVLPNPSGLNAHFQAGDFGRLFGALKSAVDGR